jgi:hypothetical protein
VRERTASEGGRKSGRGCSWSGRSEGTKGGQCCLPGFITVYHMKSNRSGKRILGPYTELSGYPHR